MWSNRPNSRLRPIQRPQHGSDQFSSGSPETTSHPAADLQAILLRALTNEHAAQSTYDHVLATLGPR